MTQHYLQWSLKSFNPAEAEEGFKRLSEVNGMLQKLRVSIQPKPKKGLKAQTFSLAKE